LFNSLNRIYVKDLLAEEQNEVAKLPPLKYRVIRANQSYRGEIDVAITFTPKVINISHLFNFL
jgi:hypothetical protein